MFSNAKIIENKMKERGFVIYSTNGISMINFISEQMYDSTYTQRTSLKQQQPIINIIVNLEKETFHCVYQIENSISKLITPECSPILNDMLFDRIVSQFEVQAKWLEKLTTKKEVFK